MWVKLYVVDGEGGGGIEMEEEWWRGWIEHFIASLTFLTPPTQCQNTAAGFSDFQGICCNIWVSNMPISEHRATN